METSEERRSEELAPVELKNWLPWNLRDYVPGEPAKRDD
jgi:hypothetical protein